MFSSLFGILSVLLVAAACAAPKEAASSEFYSAEFEKMMAESDSDFVKGILEDHQITVDELRESNQMMVDCLAQRQIGATMKAEPDGETWLLVEGHQAENEIEIFDECTDFWSASLPNLYSAMKRNPENIDPYDLEAACLVRTGGVPVGFTGEDLKRLDEEYAEANAVEVEVEEFKGGGEVPLDALPSPLWTPTAPGGALYPDEEFTPCSWYPLTAKWSPGARFTPSSAR